VLALAGVLSALPAWAAQPLPGTLPVPVPGAGFVTGGAANWAVAGNTLTVNQESQRAILNWHSFNIANDAAVRFVQPSSSAAALNRIFDAHPSVIAGRLSAYGQIYLINQNGIVFAHGAEVNVGALIASTLNIADATFEGGLAARRGSREAFRFEGDRSAFERSLVRVEDGARITSAEGGRVLLFAPRVENRGEIRSPGGQVALAAGSRVYLTSPFDTKFRGFYVEVDPFVDFGNGQDAGIRDAWGSLRTGGERLGGSVLNDSVGRLVAERGNVSLAALAVNQSGLARATSSVTLNGSVRLLARDTASHEVAHVLPGQAAVVEPRGSRGGTLVLGAGSITEVRPELGDSRGTQADVPFFAPSIEATGLRVDIRERAQLVAPGGHITVTAQAGPEFHAAGSPAVPDARLYVAPGAVIDASGTREVVLPAARNFLDIELRGGELRDAPLLRHSFLRGSTVTVDIRRGTPLFDISPFVAQIERGIGERTAAGGSVVLRSEGDLIVSAGSRLDVSGGSLRYLDGYASPTRLALGAAVIDIADATPDRPYTGFAGVFRRHDPKWGQTLVSTSAPQFVPGYVEGANAGSVTLAGHRVVLDGTVAGSRVIGPFQREAGRIPLGGELVIGDPSRVTAGIADYLTQSIVLGRDARPLPAGFGFDTPLAGDWANALRLQPARWAENGITRVGLFSNGSLTIEPGAPVELAPGGSLALRARVLDIGADLRVPAGTIDARTVITEEAPRPDGSAFLAAERQLTVRAGTRIDAAGLWVNDALPDADRMFPALIRGGSVVLSSVSDLNLGAGSLLDVSGGAWLQAGGRLRHGDGGSVVLATGRWGTRALLEPVDRQQSVLRLEGELRGHAYGAGGSIAIDTSAVRIGGAPTPASGGTGATGELHLPESFFSEHGFRRFTVSGQDELVVAPGASIVTAPQTLQASAAARTAGSGTPLSAVSERVRVAPELRVPGELALSAPSSLYGTLEVGAGAALTVEPGGMITAAAGRRLTVQGDLTARGGQVGLTTRAPGSGDRYDPRDTLWIGDGATIDVSGVFRPAPNRAGLVQGEVLPGGSIAIDAQRGFLVAETGARLRAAGSAAVLDIRRAAGDPAATPVPVASRGGSITLTAREGMLVDASFDLAPGAPGAEGGSFRARLFRQDAGDAFYGFPHGPSLLSLDSGRRFVPAGLRPGDPVPADLLAQWQRNGLLDHAGLAASGAAHLELGSQDDVAFAASGTLSASRSIVLDAPTLSAAPGVAAGLRAFHVALGNRSASQLPQTPSAGSATLQVEAGTIELAGSFALRGYASARFAAAGEIRLRGVQPDATTRALRGRLAAAGDLGFAARALYPTTASDYSIVLAGAPSGTVSFEGRGASGAPLSAGGRLSVTAPFIEQGGTLRAPFGAIELAASERLRLAPGSLTSVAAEGALIPFGETQLSGRDYVFPFSGAGTQVLAAPPVRRIALDAADLRFEPGARVDVSGGGDLVTWEFVAGPGGSRDVLTQDSTPGVFAILPGLDAPVAPFDPLLARGATASARPGDTITLTGYTDAQGGVPAGTYTLLPARYALLPGAFAVIPVANSRDALAADNRRLADGTAIVAGTLGARTLDGAGVSESRSQAFVVRSGAEVRRFSEYIETRASRFYAATPDAQLPGDAGALAVVATRSLALDGELHAAFDAGRAGATLDLVAPRLAVTGAGGAAAPAGFVQIDADALTRLQVSSLLLGGRRAARGARLSIDVGSAEVSLLNSAASPLRAPDVMLAATGSIVLGAGSRLSASGTPQPARPIDIAGADGDGAFVRAAAGEQVTVSRGAIDFNRGTLAIGAGARLEGRSIVLDATAGLASAGEVRVADGGAVRYGAPRITIGDHPAATGFVLGNADLAALGAPAEIALRSYATFDIAGAAQLGSASLGRLVIEAGGIYGYGTAAGDRATLTAQSVVFARPAGIAFGGAPAVAAGAGELRIAAGDWRLGAGAGEFTVRGFDRVSVAASSEARFEGGTLAVSGDLGIETPRLAVAPGANARVVTGRSVSGTTPGDVSAAPAAGAQAAAASAATTGGSLSVSAPHGAINIATAVENPGGSLALSAASTVRIASGAAIRLDGRTQSLFGEPIEAPGGSLRAVSSGAGIELAAGARVDLSGTRGAGSLALLAPAGTIELAGTVLGGARADDAGSQPARAGSVAIDAARLDNLAALNDALDARTGAGGQVVAGGFHGERRFRARGGDLVVAAGDSIRAAAIELAADDGSIRIGGTLDASGERGGRIELYARDGGAAGAGRVELLDGGQLRAVASAAVRPEAASAGRGGEVVIGVSGTNGRIDLQPGSQIALDAGPGGTPGRLLVRAPEVAGADGAAITRLGATVSGAPDAAIEVVRSLAFASIGAAERTAIQNAVTGLAPAATALAARFPGWAARPGIEVTSSGDLTVAEPLDLSTLRLGGEPGVLTLRAAGNLAINRSISDGFANATPAGAHIAGRSWSYRLAGGADLGAADPLAVVPQPGGTRGDVRVAAATLVRTGTGSIDIAAGRDFTLAAQTSVVYTAGRPGPAVAGFTAVDNALPAAERYAPAFPVDGGDLWLAAEGSIIGAPSTQLFSQWLYRQGQRRDDGSFNPSFRTGWWLRYRDFQQGIGALGGGDVAVTARGDILNLNAATVSNGRVGDSGSGPFLVRQGGGDLTVRAGGDLGSGVFYVDRGMARLEAAGSIRTTRQVGAHHLSTILGTGDGSLEVRAGGDIAIEGFVHPTILPEVTRNVAIVGGIRSFFFTWSGENSLDIASHRGSVTLHNDALDGVYTLGGRAQLTRVYPGSLRVTAPGGDITVGSGGALSQLLMYPAAGGRLELLAGGSLVLNLANLHMSAADPTLLPSPLRPHPTLDGAGATVQRMLLDAPRLAEQFAYARQPLHLDDRRPVLLYARSGDVVRRDDSSFLFLPKAFRIAAGRDVQNLSLFGQHPWLPGAAGEPAMAYSSITAGRDIVFPTLRNAAGVHLDNRTRIELGGPGTLELNAGRDIDLGNSAGVVTRGNLNNPFLPEGGATIRLLAGTTAPDYAGFIGWLLDAQPPAGAPQLRYQPSSAVFGSVPQARLTLDFGGRPAPADWSGVDVRPALVAFLRDATGNPGLGEAEALAAFRAAPGRVQRDFVDALLFASLLASGRGATARTAPADYAFGYDTLLRLFPQTRVDGWAQPPAGAADDPVRAALRAMLERTLPQLRRDGSGYSGSINLFFSQVKTEQDGELRLLAPGGAINAGLANPGNLIKPASELGLMTVAGGAIRALVSGDFNVNQSRVFTLGGGDILMWSSAGNIDAGRGSRTVSAAPPPQLIATGDGFRLDISNSVAGSGIGTLLGRPDAPPAAVSLFAPLGAIDAGDAGIRATGGADFGALVFVNFDNVRVQGPATGGPPVAAAPLAPSLPAGDSATATRAAEASATRAVTDAAQSAQAAPAFRPTFITVEVIGLGDAPAR
jgi:filamentous hemagglutinin family protein